MNLVNEYALLVAVSLPVAVVVAMQVYLYLEGERDTLLLPGLGGFPKVEIGLMAPVVVDVSPVWKAATPAMTPANETCEEAA